MGDISPEEIARLERARAVARHSALGDAAHWCDAIARETEAQNPGRKRGSVSQIGLALAYQAKRCGNKIWAERDKIAAAALAECDKVRAAAWADYKKVHELSPEGC